MSREIEIRNGSKYNASQGPECIFNASYSSTSLERSRSSSKIEGQIRIKRSPSYTFELDDSFEHLENAESLFGSVETTSMPNLSYLDNDEAESTTADPPRCMSAVPDLFHESLSDVSPVNYVNLSSFIKNQDEVYQSLLTRFPSSIKDNHLMDAASKISPGSQALTSTLKEVTDSVTVTKAPAQYSTITSRPPTISFENKVGACCQSNPCDIEMELLVLPMVDDFSKVELRIPSASLSAEKKKALKRVCNLLRHNVFYTIDCC